ncbi:MAG TPA: hypothetical protein VGE55_05090 [Limnobacter sp.]|uniref:hypothetical protein n=1 Tax=Limnobacter sp. TaxID=2003368 RepID=UPI002ED87FCE
MNRVKSLMIVGFILSACAHNPISNRSTSPSSHDGQQNVSQGCELTFTGDGWSLTHNQCSNVVDLHLQTASLTYHGQFPDQNLASFLRSEGCESPNQCAYKLIKLNSQTAVLRFEYMINLSEGHITFSLDDQGHSTVLEFKNQDSPS